MRVPAVRDATLPPPIPADVEQRSAAAPALALATLALVALLVASGIAGPAGADAPDRTGAEPIASWTFRGGGWGHGVGMSQYGALGMALDERSAAEIISFYYGGAKVAPATMPATVRVGMAQGRTDGVLLRAGRVPGTAAGGRLRVTATHQATGKPVVRTFEQGLQLRVVPDGAGLSITAGGRRVLGPAKPGTVLRIDYARPVKPGGEQPEPPIGGSQPPPPPVAPAPTPPTPSTVPVWDGDAVPGRSAAAGSRAAADAAAARPVLLSLPQVGRTLRWGSLEVAAVRSGTATRLRAVATMSWTAYLRGLAEVPRSWPVSTQRAQAIAARSYALATVRAAGQHRGRDSLTGCDCGVYADTRDQHYLGWAQEHGPGADRWIAAVAATDGQVVMWQGRTLVKAFYSSSNGGHTSGSEVWGGSPLPYYPAKPDPDDRAAGRNPLNTWTVQRTGAAVTAALADLRVGHVTGISAVTRDRSGRLRTVLVEGTDGSALVSGLALQRKLRLRSTLLRSATPTPRPTPPPSTSPPPPTTSPGDPDDPYDPYEPYDPGEPGGGDGGVDDGGVDDGVAPRGSTPGRPRHRGEETPDPRLRLQ
jgi:SpoIID/LytB domain protein